MTLNIDANRKAQKWTRRELLGRALWETAGQRLFAWSPRQLWGWRRIILRCFGAKIGRSVHIYPTVRIAIPWNLVVGDHAAVGDGAILYSLGRISIGARATISHSAHLCAGTHNHRSPTFDLSKPPITIGAEAWICADAFVGPGACIGKMAVVGARAVVIKDIEPGVVVTGNPARKVGAR